MAAERLGEVARVFRDSTVQLLHQVADRKLGQVVDLGCGPGFTTRLLGETLSAERTVGLERSAHFLDLARRQSPNGIAYFEHDVCTAPFPCGAANLVFCRFLLSHLPDVRAALEVWETQLEPGGLLLLDEVETIKTEHPLFEKYLGIVERMLNANGSKLYVGPVLERECPAGRFRVIRSYVRRMAVADSDAAEMFSRNVPNWRTNDYVRARFSDGEIDELLAGLTDIAASRVAGSAITWELRQMVLERVG